MTVGYIKAGGDVFSVLYRPITDRFSLFTMDQFIQPVNELQMLALLNFLESERLVRLNDIIRVRRRRRESL